jgi:hypothetical protein
MIRLEHLLKRDLFPLMIMRPVEEVQTPSTFYEMVSSRFDSHSKEEASTLEVMGEEGKGAGRTEEQDLQQL